MEEFLRQVAIGQVKLQPLITHQFPLEEASKAYETILDASNNSLAVLLRYPAADLSAPARAFAPIRRVHTRPAKPDASLRVALVGAGNLARWAHLPNLAKIPDVSLHAVYSASGARGKSYARRFGAAYCASDYEEILRDSDIDVVMIMSRNQSHCSQSVAALRAGKHVFLEKPMALTDDECRQIYQAVEESGKQLTVGFNRRFAPFYIEQKKQLSRRAGPAVVSCRVNSPGISGSYWMADPAIGGAILGEACHFVDLMYWLLESEPESVSAYSLPAEQKDPVGTNNIVASIRFADGSIGSLNYSTVGSKTSGGEQVEVFAQGLGITTEDFKKLTIKSKMRNRSSRLWPDKGYASQLEQFLRSVRTGESSEVTVVDGARATVVCLRMLESARTQNSCAIDLGSVLCKN